MKNFQVGKLTLDPRDLAILKCLQSDLPLTVLVDREGRIAISHVGVKLPGYYRSVPPGRKHPSP